MCINAHMKGKYEPFPSGVIPLWGIRNQGIDIFEVEYTPKCILHVWTGVSTAQMGPGPGPN